MNDQCQLMNQSQQMINQSQVLNRFQTMMPHRYGNWAQQNTSPMNNLNFHNQMNPKYGGRNNWKGHNRRKDTVFPGSGAISGNELEYQNRLKARRFHHKKKFNNRVRPSAHAPRNTTSYLIRAKKEGGIASLISPCPVTPSVLPTPVFSPSREALVDMAKEEWGVDGYGSMKGLIRLRENERIDCEEEEEDEGDSSVSDVEEHVEVERRLDQDLSRFEMIGPSFGSEYANGLENRVDDQDSYLLQLEGENVALKERLYLMERELGEVKRRMQCLERQSEVMEEIHEEVVENVSENDDSEGTMNNEVDYDEVLKDGTEDKRKDDELANEDDGLDMNVNYKNETHDKDLIKNGNHDRDLIKNGNQEAVI